MAGRPTILVERFDQAPAPGGEPRRFYLSAHTLLGLGESVLDRRKWSYLELAMTCGALPGRERWASRTNLISGCQHFGLIPDEAASIIDEILAVVTASWHAEVRAQGGTDQDRKNVAYAIAYEGFEVDP